MKTDQDATDYTNGQRSPEAAQHHRQQAQRLEHRGRHGLHLQPHHHAQRPRLLLPGRGQARLSRHGDRHGGPAGPVAERLVAVPTRTDRPLVYSPYLVVESTARAQFGVQNFWYQEPNGYSLHARLSKYFTKHSLKARHRDPLEAGRGGALLLRGPALRRPGDRERLGQPEHQDGPPLGQLPARRHGRVGPDHRRRRQLERPVQPAPDRQHRDVRLLRPGRLPGHQQADAQPRPALRVRGRPLGSREPASAAARPHRPHPRHGGGDRPARSRPTPGP